MRKIIAAVCALTLTGAASPALAVDTDAFKDGLKAACQKWMEGAERKALSTKLQADGWEATADAIFSKFGDWGRVSVALQQPGGGDGAKPNWMKDHVNNVFGPQPGAVQKRSCDINYSTNGDPWTTQPAAAEAAAWIVIAFPKAERKNSVSTTIGGQMADGTLWGDGKVKITQVAYKAKQASPNSDLLLKVEHE
jgi:hypothetical protein